MDELEQEVRRLLSAWRKVDAVKQVRDATNWNLREAKDYVDAIEAGKTPPIPEKPITAAPEIVAVEVRDLIAQGRKIEAIKKVRTLTGWGLKEAKDFVDALD
ncbi:MAG: ribosomal protein L7/L12 [Chloroflexota bacterium]